MLTERRWIGIFAVALASALLLAAFDSDRNAPLPEFGGVSLTGQ